MGKNQQHKAQQRSRHGGEGEDLPDGDTSVDVSFHTSEWHAARVAALTAERKTWEEWKLEQKEKASALAAVEEDEDRQNREYKAQLAADRAVKLSGGTNQADLSVKSGKVSKKSHKDKGKKSHKSDKNSKKHKESKHSKKKHKSHDKDHKSKRKQVHSSGSSDTSGSISDAGDNKLAEKSSGPVKLSDFMKE